MENKPKHTPMMEQYLSIKENHKDCLVFYRMGDFYELFFDDAIIASAVLDIVLTKRGKTDGTDIPMCGVPYHAFENYMAKLIRAGHKVAVCEQIESPEDAKKARGHSAVVKREVVRIISAGTIIEDKLLSSENNFLCSVFSDQNNVSASWIDISTGDFFISKIKEDVLSFISKLNPSEILLPDDTTDENISKISDFFKEKITYIPSIKFNLNTNKDSIQRAFKVSDINSFGKISNEEAICAGVVLNYIENTNKTEITNINPPKSKEENGFVDMDLFTFKNLEIMENVYGERGQGASLFSVIDYTKTSAGRRMLGVWLKNPIRDLTEINRRQNCVEIFSKKHNLKSKIDLVLKEIPDVERSVSRLFFNKGGPRDLANILLFIQKSLDLKITYNGGKDSDSAGLFTDIDKIINSIPNLNELESFLKSSVDSNESLPLLARDGGFVKDGFNAKLDEYRDVLDDNKQYLNNLQQKYSAQTSVQNLKIKYNNVLGYYIEVQSKNAEPLMNDKESFIHRQTMANAVRFSTTELADLENKIREADSKKLALELQIFEEIRQEILKNADNLKQAANNVSQIDVFSSFAYLAIEKNYNRPIIDNSTAFEITNGRHPVVEFNIHKDLKDFAGNNCVLEQKSSQYSPIWILTGPNMAGKSTFLRQNALIALLAHTGCFVPAQSAHIGIVDKIFSRVGASDNLAKGQSTFMVEMIETSAILNTATEKSLVILDEIGRGTATFDGFSIAWAVLEYLNNKSNCRTLFATHYHELTDLSEKLDKVSNHTMQINEWEDEIIFMHKVIAGTADKSYGIHVAKLAGIPASVIKRSEEILEKLESGEGGQTTQSVSKICEGLPLFDDKYLKNDAKKQAETVEKSRKTHIIKELEDINPDYLSPKEALEKLYELKKL